MKESFICLLVLLLSVSSVNAITRYVPSEYNSIQTALNACTTGDSVLVAPGVYLENIIWPQVDGIILQSTNGRLNTVIDANHNGRGVGFVCSWQTPVITLATKLKGFTIRNGQSMLNGAGIICYYASPEITDCIVTNNSCSEAGSGGGLYCYSASPHLTNVIIVYNTAYSGGGAHIDPLSSPIFDNCVIADNTLSSPGGSYAAGIYGRYEVYFQLNNCTITRNRYLTASAIHLGEVCTPILRHSTITDNYNGVLVVHNGGIDVQNCNISGNTNTGLWHNDTDGDILNIQNNWWNSPTGPYHVTGNPTGFGEYVQGNVNLSNWLQAPDSFSPPIPPVNAGIIEVANTSFTIWWEGNPEPNIDYYIINYGIDSQAVIFPNSIQTSDTQFTVNNLTPNTLYSVQIAAVNSNNIHSWYSVAITVQTLDDNAGEDPVIMSPVLLNSYPNPFQGSTVIRYELKQSEKASMSIYNVKGELVKNIFAGIRNAGASEVTWNGRNENNEPVSAGIYFARLEQNSKVSIQKLIIVK